MAEGQFTTIGEDECRKLLRSVSVGRVGWVSETQGQLVLPVNYSLCDDLIVFRTAPGTVLSELAHSVSVAFEVDSIDEEATNGWSVMVQGNTELLGEERLNPLPRVWAPGNRNVVVAIHPMRITGRAVLGKE